MIKFKTDFESTNSLLRTFKRNKVSNSHLESLNKCTGDKCPTST